MATFMMLRVDEIPEVFTDLAPIPQNDGPEPVCAIQYPTAFRVAYDYMRACWKSGEHSERSLQLSATCLKLNPANYTVWHYRRACMEKLEYLDGSETGDLERTKTKIQEDLTLAAQLGGGNPKNYQIWYHRRALLEAFDQKTKEGRAAAADDNDATAAATAFETEFFESEDAYIMEVILLDSKNYHAWSHRQWLIRTVNKPAVWDRELEFGEYSTTSSYVRSRSTDPGSI
jgi:protein farnesyltransferase/geranylgeranyltransferase type-1 subunit alpha